MNSDPKSWVGKRIGVAKNSQGDFALRWSLAKAGIPVSDVKIVFIAPTVAVPAYQRNDVDGYYVWDVGAPDFRCVGAKLVSGRFMMAFRSSSIWA